MRGILKIMIIPGSKLSTILIILGAALLLPFSQGVVLAQRVVVPDAPEPTNSRHKKTHKESQKQTHLEHDELALATEYVAILTSLKSLSRDYRRYFTRVKLGRRNRIRYQLLDSLPFRIDRGHYAYDLKRLTFDLEKLKSDLETQEKEYESAQRAYEAALKSRNQHTRDYDAAREFSEAIRLSINLQSELSIIQEQFNEQFEFVSFKSNGNFKNICVFIEEACAELAEQSRGTNEGPVFVIDYNISEVEVAGTAPQVSVSVTTPPVPSLPPLPGLPAVIVTDRAIVYSQGRRGARVITERTDSLVVDSRDVPIFIVNPIGKLVIEGWDRNVVSVSSVTDLKGDSEATVISLGSKIELKVHRQHQRVFVELQMPEFSDPGTEILTSNLYVKMPLHNVLHAVTSYGEANISNISADVTLRANNTTVNGVLIDGDVKIFGSSSPITLRRINGDISIKNSRAPVSLDECAGRIDILGSFALIELTRCTGDARLKGIGTVTVSNHHGTVDIDNSKGVVEINRLEGDLIVQNSYDALLVNHVSGATELVNVNGRIEVAGIDGPLSISNFRGATMIRAFGGPLDLNSHGGNVELYLLESLRGPSSISASGGMVSLMLSNVRNLTIKAETSNGRITSSIPGPVMTNAANVSTATYSFGAGVSQLTVVGNKTNIHIEKVK